MLLHLLVAIATLELFASAQIVRTDPGVYGPALEIAHLYYDEWPTGIAVSSTGRMFSNYPAGLDANNTNTGSNGKYAVAELLKNNTEVPYPSTTMNSPPSGAINRTTTPPTSANYVDYLIGVQSVVIDSLDRLWILDTGRVLDPTTGELLYAAVGGPKLVGVNLSNNSVFQTIVFPATVAYPDSYLNDVRFDLRPNLSGANSSGVAYITDSSSEGRDGIIIVDLASGNSWRHLNTDPRVHPEQQFVPYVWGQAIYGYQAGEPKTFIGFGADGIALSSDGNTLFFAPTSGRSMYSISTSLLRLQGAMSEVKCQAGVQSLGQKGVTDGFETDTNGFIYMGQVEQEGLSLFNPANQSVTMFVRDPRINWVDTLSIATDNYLYFTVNQLNFSPQTWPGTDRRIHPYVLFRTKLPNGGTKVILK